MVCCSYSMARINPSACVLSVDSALIRGASLCLVVLSGSLAPVKDRDARGMCNDT